MPYNIPRKRGGEQTYSFVITSSVLEGGGW